MNEKEFDSGLEECHEGTLLEKYGPDYEPLKTKLGYIKGLFE